MRYRLGLLASCTKGASKYSYCFAWHYFLRWQHLGFRPVPEKLVFFNPARSRGFISPFGLRVIAGVFAIIPVAALVLGTFWEKPVLHSVMTVAYIVVVLRLLGMARERSENA